MTRVSRETWDWAESEGFELGQHRVQAKVMVSWCEQTNKQTDKNNLKHKAASCQPLQNCTKGTCCSWVCFFAFLSNCRPRPLKSLSILNNIMDHPRGQKSQQTHALHCITLCLQVYFQGWLFICLIKNFSWWLMGKNIHLQCSRCGFNPWVGKIPWRRKWQSTVVFLPGKFHGQRSLAGYSPWDPKESDMTEQLATHTKRTLVIESFFYFTNL